MLSSLYNDDSDQSTSTPRRETSPTSTPHLDSNPMVESEADQSMEGEQDSSPAASNSSEHSAESSVAPDPEPIHTQQQVSPVEEVMAAGFFSPTYGSEESEDSQPGGESAEESAPSSEDHDGHN